MMSTKKLQVGDKAPYFEGVTQHNDKVVKLTDFTGKKIILYFYPRDNTPGCTKQACNLQKHTHDIQAKGYSVIGVSADSVASHNRFAQKYTLQFPLIADPDRKIINAYGVNGLLGYPKRTTFLIDEKGYIEAIFDKVKTANHTQQLFPDIQSE